MMYRLMFKTLFLTVALTCGYFSPVAAAATKTSDQVNWITAPIGELVEMAKQQNKKLLGFAYQFSCGACRWMWENTLTDPAVVEIINKNFISTGMQLDYNPELAARFMLHTLPAVVVVNTDLVEVDRWLGAPRPAQLESFKAWLIDVALNGKSVTELEALLAGDPTNSALKFQIVDKYYKQSNARPLAAMYERIASEHPDLYARRRTELDTKLGTALYWIGEGERSASVLRGVLAMENDSWQIEAYRMLAFVHECLHQWEDMYATLDQAVKAHPQVLMFATAYVYHARTMGWNYERAGEIGTAALSIDNGDGPQMAYFRYNLAELRRNMGLKQLSLEAINSAIELDPREEYIQFKTMLLGEMKS